VPLDRRDLADATLKTCRADLGLPALRVQWFKADSAERQRFRQRVGHPLDGEFTMPRGHRGHVCGESPATLYLSADIAADALLVEVLAHEAKHAAQHLAALDGQPHAHDMTDPAPDSLHEREAGAYGRKVRGEYERLEALSDAAVLAEVARELNCGEAEARRRLGVAA
jgi:hypothetical protein